MHYAPILKQLYGSWARGAFWLLTMLLMVVAANAALAGLRSYVGHEPPSTEILMLEIWFSLLALAVAFGLILRRLNRNNME
jgi:hypothetical protein